MGIKSSLTRGRGIGREYIEKERKFEISGKKEHGYSCWY
jgi:hypothetical protein